MMEARGRSLTLRGARHPRPGKDAHLLVGSDLEDGVAPMAGDEEVSERVDGQAHGIHNGSRRPVARHVGHGSGSRKGRHVACGVDPADAVVRGIRDVEVAVLRPGHGGELAEEGGGKRPVLISRRRARVGGDLGLERQRQGLVSEFLIVVDDPLHGSRGQYRFVLRPGFGLEEVGGLGSQASQRERAPAAEVGGCNLDRRPDLHVGSPLLVELDHDVVGVAHVEREADGGLGRAHEGLVLQLELKGRRVRIRETRERHVREAVRVLRDQGVLGVVGLRPEAVGLIGRQVLEDESALVAVRGID
ncbi:hypothetical protein D3C87_1004290 [compost metagenome]